MRTDTSRRAFLAAVGATAASATLAAATGKYASSAKALPGTVDVHHHFFPPFFMEKWSSSARAATDFVLPQVGKWSPASVIEQMDGCGAGTAVLSTNYRSFLLDLTQRELRQLARECNEYATKMAHDYPGRFGLFTFLPMPDIEGTLKEIEYAMDMLKATGIHMMTSYGEKWLGDPTFQPVLEELNRRRAVVFVHPKTPVCCGNLMPHIGSVDAGLLEYPYDTGRAIVSLLLSGSLSRFPDIAWIFSHAGGPIPVLAVRIRDTAPRLVKNFSEVVPRGVDYELRRLYYDVAVAAAAPSMAALLEYVPLKQVLFGTDYPFFPMAKPVGDFDRLKLTRSQRQAIQRENPRRLMPSLVEA